ncbi:MAG: hypothetical protein ACOYXC_07290 [Candidatus Rifleibacteriota bacterium]
MMRRSFLGFFLLSFVLMSNPGIFAQKVIDRDQINNRIKELRNRLKEYQTGKISNAQAKPEEKPEEISEELENRKDVAVTVLFHDSENAGDAPINETIDLNDHLSNMEASLSEISELKTISEEKVLTPEKQRLNEMKKRQELFESLRNKVQQATRRSRRSALEINRLVAQVPEL